MKSIFVSSTFRDMQAERDALMLKVVPEINLFARKYGELIRFADLRWGVNTTNLDEESGNRKVITVCLDQIDQSRPYMIIFIGERYGWITQDKALLLQVTSEKNYPLDDLDKSITELEIEYGALQKNGMLERCLFYFRKPLPQAQIPEAYRNVYIDEQTHMRNKLQLLRKKIQNSGALVKEYECQWDEKAHRLAVSDCFSEMILQDLKGLFQKELETNENLCWQEQEKINGTVFAMHKCQHFNARYHLIAQYKHIIENECTLFMLRGVSGSGKSSILSKLYEEYSKTNPTLLIACGMSSNSQTSFQLIQQMVYQLETLLQIEEHFEDTTRPLKDWVEKLQRYAYEYHDKKGTTVYIFCDAIDQLLYDETTAQYTWLPNTLPPSIKIVLSMVAEFEVPVFYPMKEVSCIERLEALTKEDTIQVVQGILAFMGKELEPVLIEEMIQVPHADNPLYLSLMLQRILMFDREDFAQIDRYSAALGNAMQAINKHLRHIIKDTPDTVEGISCEVVREAAAKINEPLCMEIVKLIAISRYGLRELDFRAVIEQSNLSWDSTDFALFLKYLSGLFLFREDGRIDFTHKTIRKGIQEICNQQEYHSKILQHLHTLNNEDALKASEIVYHSLAVAAYDTLVPYISEAQQCSTEISEIVLQELHHCSVAYPNEMRALFEGELTYGATDAYLRLMSAKFPASFLQTTTEQQILYALLKIHCRNVEAYVGEAKAVLAAQLLLQSYIAWNEAQIVLCDTKEEQAEILARCDHIDAYIEAHHAQFVSDKERLFLAQAYDHLASAKLRFMDDDGSEQGIGYGLQVTEILDEICEQTQNLEIRAYHFSYFMRKLQVTAYHLNLIEPALIFCERLVEEGEALYRDMPSDALFFSITKLYFEYGKLRAQVEEIDEAEQWLGLCKRCLESSYDFAGMSLRMKCHLVEGQLCALKGALPEARNHYETAAGIAEELYDKALTSEANVERSVCYGHLGDFHTQKKRFIADNPYFNPKKALCYYTKEYDIASTLSKTTQLITAKQELAKALGGLGDCALYLKTPDSYDKAEAYYQEMVKITYSLTSGMNAADSYIAHGESFYRLSQVAGYKKQQAAFERHLDDYKYMVEFVFDSYQWAQALPKYTRLKAYGYEYVGYSGTTYYSYTNERLLQCIKLLEKAIALVNGLLEKTALGCDYEFVLYTYAQMLTLKMKAQYPYENMAGSLKKYVQTAEQFVQTHRSEEAVLRLGCAYDYAANICRKYAQLADASTFYERYLSFERILQEQAYTQERMERIDALTDDMVNVYEERLEEAEDDCAWLAIQEKLVDVYRVFYELTHDFDSMSNFVQEILYVAQWYEEREDTLKENEQYKRTLDVLYAFMEQADLEEDTVSCVTEWIALLEKQVEGL